MVEVDFFASVKELAHSQHSLYQGNAKDRRKLLDFLEMNDWFRQIDGGLTYNAATKGKLYVTEKQADFLLSSLSLWLAGYHRENHEKLEILMLHGEKKLPQTVAFYREFISAERLENEISAWRLLDFLLYHLPMEIDMITPSDEERMIDTLDREATRSVSDLYARFSAWMQKKRGANGWRYKFEYRKKRDKTEAYTARQFSGMAYCLLNDEWWERQRLVEKACGSASFANLWAFLSMHFVCGLRSTDIVRIPKPELPVNGEKFREMAMNGEVEAPEKISQDLQIRIRYRPKRPNKTMAASWIPDVKVFIPVSLEKPMGIILGIAASHFPDVKPGQTFLRQDRSPSRTRNFLGKEFMDILGGKGFASSRANKAYLQGLEMMADTSESNVRGYMIAALARSHKGGLGSLPDVTDIYLRDAAFSGYNPKFIAREMFERGVFGFLPHLLMSVYCGDDYKNLSIPEQTYLIKEVGIRPTGIESIVQICEASLAESRKAVADIISTGVTVSDTLQAIASGRAVSKQDGCLCVMTGAGFTCAFPDRTGCIGCRYEVHTKSLLHQLTSEYTRMKNLSSGADGWRYQAMVRKAILPVIGEYLTAAMEAIPGVDMDTLSEIMEGGLTGYVHSSKQAVGDGLQPVSGG